MSDRPWNGNLIENNHQGVALQTVITDKLLAPCIIMVMATMSYLVVTVESTRVEMVAGIVVSVPLSIVLGAFVAVGLGLAIVAVLAILIGMFAVVGTAVDAWR